MTPPGKPIEPVPREHRFVGLICLALVVLTVLLYGRMLSYPFAVADDYRVLVHSDLMQKGLSLEGLRLALTTGYQYDWMPLGWVFQLVVYSLSGTHPLGYHLLSLCLHAAAAVVLFCALRRLTGRTGPSAVVAAVFALHPMHVRAVASASEWGYPQAALFGAASLYTYACYTQSRRGRWYIATLLLQACGHMSYMVFATWPIVFILLDIWPLRRWRKGVKYERRESPKKLLLEKLPFLSLSVAHVGITMAVRSGTVSSEGLPFPLRMNHAVCTCVTLLRRMFWPTDLAYLYNHPYGAGGTPWTMLQVAACAALLLVITAAGIGLWTRGKRYPLVGWLWFVVLLAPVSGFIQSFPDTAADRYVYLPGIGIWLVVAWSVCDLRGARGMPACSRKPLPGPLSRWSGTRKRSGRTRSDSLGDTAGGYRLTDVLVPALLVALGLLAHRQVGFYESDFKNGKRALALDPDNFLAHNELAQAYALKGDWSNCLAHCEKAARILDEKPGRMRTFAETMTHSWLGKALIELGRIDTATGLLERMRTVYPRNAGVHYDLGRAYLAAGKRDRALASFRAATRARSPEDLARRHPAAVRAVALAHSAIGVLHLRDGDVQQACAELGRAVELSPGTASVQYNYGNALLVAGRLTEAAAAYSRAIRIDPGHSAAHGNLGLVQVRLGNGARAEFHFRRALELDPSNTDARANLELLLHETPRDGASTPPSNG